MGVCRRGNIDQDAFASALFLLYLYSLQVEVVWSGFAGLAFVNKPRHRYPYILTHTAFQKHTAPPGIAVREIMGSCDSI